MPVTYVSSGTPLPVTKDPMLTPTVELTCNIFVPLVPVAGVVQVITPVVICPVTIVPSVMPVPLVFCIVAPSNSVPVDKLTTVKTVDAVYPVMVGLTVVGTALKV